MATIFQRAGGLRRLLANRHRAQLLLRCRSNLQTKASPPFTTTVTGHLCQHCHRGTMRRVEILSPHPTFRLAARLPCRGELFMTIDPQHTRTNLALYPTPCGQIRRVPTASIRLSPMPLRLPYPRHLPSPFRPVHYLRPCSERLIPPPYPHPQLQNPIQNT